jgi:hypothetical protein
LFPTTRTNEALDRGTDTDDDDGDGDDDGVDGVVVAMVLVMSARAGCTSSISR